MYNIYLDQNCDIIKKGPMRSIKHRKSIKRCMYVEKVTEECKDLHSSGMFCLPIPFKCNKSDGMCLKKKPNTCYFS